jgi:hypothetical protein
MLPTTINLATAANIRGSVGRKGNYSSTYIPSPNDIAKNNFANPSLKIANDKTEKIYILGRIKPLLGNDPVNTPFKHVATIKCPLLGNVSVRPVWRRGRIPPP